MMNEKLLIVDDNGDIRRLLRISLGYGKYKMFEAGTGQEALTIAKEQCPDVILLDVMMPGELDGFEVCSQIKGDPSLKDCFVVILTALNGVDDQAEGKRVHADCYMRKPFSPLELIEVIETRNKSAISLHGA